MKDKTSKRNHTKSLGVSGFAIVVIVIALLLASGVIIGFMSSMDFSDIIVSSANSAGIWFALIGIGTVLIIFGITMIQVSPYSKILYTLARIGMALVSLSLLVVVVTILLPLLAAKTLTFEECTDLVYTKNIYKTIGCLLVGYTPGDPTNVTYVNFIITSIICPLVFFYYIFKDVLGYTSFPSDPRAQRVISFIGAYITVRGFLETYFINFFEYSWVGMGALAFGVFMLTMVWGIIKRYFMAVIIREDMQRLFAMLSGTAPLMPKHLLMYIVNNPAPYDFLHSNITSVINLFNAAGLNTLALQVQNVLATAPAPPGDRNGHVKTQLTNIARTL